MLDRSEISLNEQLTQAEEEVHRLKCLAAEAPQRRLEKAEQDLQEERERIRQNSMDQARKEMETAMEMQTQVPALVDHAVAASQELYKLLREICSHRQEATKSLAIADRVDYETELEEAEEHENALNRSTEGLDWALAGRHGEAPCKQAAGGTGPRIPLPSGLPSGGTSPPRNLPTSSWSKRYRLNERPEYGTSNRKKATPVNVDYPEEHSAGYHVILDSGQVITVRWDQVHTASNLT